MPYVRDWCAFYLRRIGRKTALLDPGFDLSQIPDNAAWRKIEALWKFTPLFHLIDRCVGERHDFPQLGPPDGASNRARLDMRKHRNPVLGVVSSHCGIG